MTSDHDINHEINLDIDDDIDDDKRSIIKIMTSDHDISIWSKTSHRNPPSKYAIKVCDQDTTSNL